MKSVRYLPIGLAMVVAVFGAGVASASLIIGKATAVTTVTEERSNDGFHARLRVRISNGTCDNNPVAQDLFIIIRSGRMDGIFAHRGVNMKNAYSTLLAAFLSGTSVQIDGFPNCSPNAFGEIFMDLGAGAVGVFQ